MKLTKDDYIYFCNKVHNFKYDYSLVDLNDKKIKIICPTHGLFVQNKTSHKKFGCWKCSVEKRANKQRLSKEEFIEKSVLIHNKKYDYTLVDYRNYQTKIKIICPEHGEFLQQPSSHINGNGCPKCGKLSMIKNNSHNLEKFIEKANIKHNNKYCYSLVNYLNNNSYIEIICPEHGKFKQLTNNHLSGQGCPKCVGKSLSKDEILDRCRKIHNNKYEYLNIDIIKKEVLINCEFHGHFFQKLNNHMNMKQGCPKCKGLKKTTDDFIRQSIDIHGDVYDYSEVEYILAKKKVKIICKKHGIFEQAPTHHLSGQSCPKCNCSNGERIINKILSDRKINYKHHHVFNDFTNYEFDFYLPEKNLCIEYDGVQHFKPVSYFGGLKSFELQKIRDEIKNEYCKKNDIKLLRISYLEDNIEILIKKEIEEK